MSEEPTLFVARDRARRFARYIREALQERRLHYRGSDIGVTALVDEAEAALAAVVEDLTTSVGDVLAGRSYLAGTPAEAHFGLGDATTVDTLRVTWADGTERVFRNVAADRVLRVDG